MTTTSEFLTKGETLSVPVRTLDGARSLVRVIRRVGGAGLILAAVGLWVMPGSNWAAEVLLIKLVLSLVSGFVGLALVQNGATKDRPEVEIDVVRRRVQLVSRAPGRDIVLYACSFAELGRAEKHMNSVTLWDANGNILAEVVPADRTVLRSLVSGLRDAGKL
jgi:hypothetical protein